MALILLCGLARHSAAQIAKRQWYVQVLKGVHGGIREVALKMLLDVADPHKQLERFTKVSVIGDLVQ